MYIFKNALLAISRNKSRTILTAIILVIIGVSSTIALSIRSASSKLIDSYYDTYLPEATIGIKRENMNEKFKNSRSKRNVKKEFANINLSEEEIKKYGKSSYVNSYYYTATTNMNAKNIEASSSDANEENTMPGNGKDKQEERKENGAFSVVGYNSKKAMSEFISGTYTITEGEVSDDFNSNECLINEELASLNNLKVGSKVTLVDPNNTKKTYQLVVKGIYKDNDTSNQMEMFSNSSNKIITNSNQVLKMNSSSRLSVTYVLKNYKSLEKFKTEVKEKGLNENLEVQDNLSEVKEKVEAISNVKTFAITFLIIILIIGAILLFTLNIIHIRKRKYEIGVLRTIGMTKRKLTLQFVFEMLIIAIFSLLIGTGIGACFSVPISNHLLKSEIEANSEKVRDINNNFGKREENKTSEISNASIEKIEDMHAVVNFSVILELFGIGILLTILSSSASMIAIQRFSPLTILKERS